MLFLLTQVHINYIIVKFYLNHFLLLLLLLLYILNNDKGRREFLLVISKLNCNYDYRPFDLSLIKLKEL